MLSTYRKKEKKEQHETINSRQLTELASFRDIRVAWNYRGKHRQDAVHYLNTEFRLGFQLAIACCFKCMIELLIPFAVLLASTTRGNNVT